MNKKHPRDTWTAEHEQEKSIYVTNEHLNMNKKHPRDQWTPDPVSWCSPILGYLEVEIQSHGVVPYFDNLVAGSHQMAPITTDTKWRATATMYVVNL